MAQSGADSREGVSGLNCQVDIGFGGPGDSLLQLCGAGLASGQASHLTLSNAAPFTTGILVLGNGQSPTPFFGGTLVPFPARRLTMFTTTETGDLFGSFVFTGGGGPAVVYMQAVYFDEKLPGGLGLSNVIELDVKL